MKNACMRVGYELDPFEVWGGVELGRHTGLMPADRLRIRYLVIVRRSNQMLSHRARVSQ